MATEQITITLPTEIAERIRDHVRSGEYTSESEVIADRFLDEDGLSPDELDEAFRLGVEALEEMEQDPNGWLTHEQFWANFDAHRASLKTRCA